MKHLFTGGVAVAALIGIAALPGGAKAMPGSGITAPHGTSAVVTVANRRAPYRNVNRSNDAGNDTGDSQVDQLNSMSLQQAQSGQPAMGAGMGGAAMGGQGMSGQGMSGQGMGGQGMGGQGMSGQAMSSDQDMSSDQPQPRRRAARRTVRRTTTRTTTTTTQQQQ